MLTCVASSCSVLQGVVMCCAALCCSEFLHMAHESAAEDKFVAVCCYSPMLKFTATHCITLQRLAVCCCVLQCVATYTHMQASGDAHIQPH